MKIFKRRGSRPAVVVLAGLLVMTGAVAAGADQFLADTDTLATSPGAGNGLDADQAVDTTVAYDFSAAVRASGNDNDNVFVTSDDRVNVSITSAGAWRTTPTDLSRTTMQFSAYEVNETATVSVTVPSDACGDTSTVSVTLTPTATNGETFNPDSVTLRFNITATCDEPCPQTYTTRFLAPFDGSTPSNLITNTMKNGRVVPVKITIFDNCTQSYVTNLTEPLPSVTIGLRKTTDSTGTAYDGVEAYADAGASSGNTSSFRWSTDGFWIYNLDSKALALVTNSTYRVDAYVNTVKATDDTFAMLKPVK